MWSCASRPVALHRPGRYAQLSAGEQNLNACCTDTRWGESMGNSVEFPADSSLHRCCARCLLSWWGEWLWEKLSPLSRTLDSEDHRALRETVIVGPTVLIGRAAAHCVWILKYYTDWLISCQKDDGLSLIIIGVNRWHPPLTPVVIVSRTSPPHTNRHLVQCRLQDN